MKVLGIDLAGKEENPSGICILEDNEIHLKTIYTDNDIIELSDSLKPSLIVIDAPLSLPNGRCCLEKDCECAVGGHFRQAEHEIRKYGPILPLTFKGMKMLTFRGVSIASELRKYYDVFESHPRTNQKILGFKDSLSGLSSIFRIPNEATEHELDGCLAALTGFLYLEGCCIELGNPEEGIIIIPKNKKCLELIRKD